jgi:methionine synthase II (cobalamin-independent)
VGVIDIEDLRVERPEKIVGWLRKTVEVVPPEQVCVSTDCAIASTRGVVVRRNSMRWLRARRSYGTS